jgi:F0F1-type ATP synthase assembly protein I
MTDPAPPTPPSEDDPRLAIPEVLKNPPPGTPKLEPDRPRPPSQALQMGRAWAMAMDFVFTIIAGAVLGWLFDRWRGTAPAGALIGLAVGFVLAFYRIVRATQKQEAAERRAKEQERGGR